MKSLELLILLWLTACSALPQVNGPLASKKILILHAYEFGIPAYEEIDQGIVSSLYKDGVSRSSLDFEFLDLRRHPEPEYRENMAALLRQKYDSEQFDLVIAVAPPSLSLVMDDLHGRYQMFKGVPVIGVAIQDERVSATTEYPLLLITDHIDVRGTVRTALDLLPGTRHILLVSGVAEMDKQNEFRVQRELREWADRLDISSLSNLPLDKVLLAVSGAQTDSIVLCLGMAADVSGRKYIPAEVAAAVAKVSAVPVFGFADTHVRAGLVGGFVKDYLKEGQEAGQVAARILKGELSLLPPPPPIRIPSLPLFDWRQMKRWGLDEARLPKGSVIENRPVTIWSQHPWYVMGTAAFVVLESLLIAALSLQVRRRRAAVASLTHELEERKRAEREKNSLQLQLAHSQKMESIGRLAGGVAHDFNNLMNVMILYIDSALQDLKSGDPLIKSITEIQKAAERAVELTRRLMAFSHQQALQPKILNLNSVIAEFEKMVRPLVGEDINVVFLPGSGLGLVKADSGQIGQIVMNLAVNSRDAMPRGGSLIFETANADLDEANTRLNPEAKPGAYVMFAVRDTGDGMDPETQARMFEPFFTSKDVGKGTGLGLSVVYGIVKQSDGFITVHSEPGNGTEFKIYLPRVLETAAPVPAPEAEPLRRGVETILLTEDEPSLREKIRELLEDAGYRVLVARDVNDAIQIATQTAGPLHLLLTDVVMPHLSGPQLARRLQPLRPEMKVLYMSGYPEPLKARSVLEPEANLIEKPFTQRKLLHRLREVLEGKELPR